MVLATWWYEDGQSRVDAQPGFTVESPEDDGVLRALAALPPGEVVRRRAEGHRPYIASIDGQPAAYGWVATQHASIGELGLDFDMPAGNRYLWDFATLPAFRGRGVYPALLGEIVRRECPPATRLWIIHAPENLPSGVGIARAGFRSVAELSFDHDGKPALARITDPTRAPAGSGLLGIPLVEESLDPCWACGGCRCHRPAESHDECACAIVPSR